MRTSSRARCGWCGETGKPIAQVARELGINEGTLGNWCARERRGAVRADGALSEDERAELVRLRKENAELRMQRDVLKRSVALWVRRGDGPVAVAGFIAAQRAEHRIPHATACRALGGQPGLVLQVAPRRPVAAACPPGAADGRDRPAVRRAPRHATGRRGSPRICAMRAGGSVRTPSRRSCASSGWRPGRKRRRKQHHPAGPGPVAGTGPDRPRFRRRPG